jgi:hypothetical protein
MNRKQDLLSTFLIRFVHSLSDSELKELLEDMDNELEILLKKYLQHLSPKK